MSYTQFHDEDETGATHVTAPGKSDNAEGEKMDDTPPAYSPPADQSQQPNLYDGMPQQTVDVTSHYAEPGVIYTPTRRMRAQARHVVFVVFSYIMFCIFDSSFLVPIPLAGFICALVSLWKQERGDPKTSNILGYISLALSILSVIIFIVLMAVEVSLLFPYRRTGFPSHTTTAGPWAQTP